VSDQLSDYRSSCFVLLVARKNGIVSNPELITAVDLDQWSGTLAAQTTLPILVRRLILATAPVSTKRST